MNAGIRLQLILTLAEKLLPDMSDSPLKCKLLAYCYYYVEDPECAREAKDILDSWDANCLTEEMAEASLCYQELVR